MPRIVHFLAIASLIGALTGFPSTVAIRAQNESPQLSTLAATARVFPGAAPCDTTLQACIDASGPGDEIDIMMGTYSITETTITRPLTLNGAGAGLTVLKAVGANRVLHIGANITGGVAISNLTVTGGSNAANGAGIFGDTGTSFFLTNLEVTSNTSTSNGGGIMAVGPLAMNNVKVDNNHAPGGAGGGLRSNSTVTIQGGSFTNNTSFNPGGAMRVDGLLTISDTLVLTNSISAAGTNGGGIQADGGLVMSGGRVSNNRAPNAGGGIYASSVTISGTAVTFNQADQGGGLFSLGKLDLNNALFLDNQALAGSGGGLYAASITTTVRLTGTSAIAITAINGNVATANGGGIFAMGDVRLYGAVVLDNNGASGEGGAIYANAVTDSPGNVPAILSFVNEQFQGNFAVGNGGAIRALANVTLLNDPGFRNNQVGMAGNGGAIYAQDVNLQGGQFTTFEGNSSGNAGGGVYAINSVALKDASSFNNYASSNGAAIYAANLAQVANATFNNNTAGSQGGAVWVGVSGVVTSSIFISNTAQQGGAWFAAGALTLTGNQFISNTVTGTAGDGGGIFAAAGPITSTHNILRANTAARFGGGAVLGNASITGDRYISNTSGSEGGGLQGKGSISLQGALFDDNQSSLSGAFVYQSAAGTLFPGRIINSLFTRNRASSSAGANDMRVFDWKVDLIHDTFANTTTVGIQPAISFFRSALTVTNTIIANDFKSLFEGQVGPISQLSEDYNIFFNTQPPTSTNLISGGHSFSADPLFVDPTNQDYHLTPGSPAVDKGILTAVTVDFDGEARPIGAGVDIGFDEGNFVKHLYLPVVRR